MAYYQGDYYQGDYYQGDPFLGALIGGGISWLTKKIFKRKLTAQGQITAGRKVMTTARRAAPVAAGLAVASGASLPIPFTPFKVQPGAFMPGGAPLISRRLQPDIFPAAAQGGACCPSGFHMAKDQSGRCVRNRSMNVANPRALRRSLRRIAGFGKLAQRSKQDIKRAARALGA